jgi:hypothetical protein
VIARFAQIDPLADMFGQESVSSYAAFWNNPIRYQDKWGLCPECPFILDPSIGYEVPSVDGHTYKYQGDGLWKNLTKGGTDFILLKPVQIKPKTEKDKEEEENDWLNGLQLGLDILGSTEIPVASQVGDIVSGIISLIEGDFVGAGLSAGGAIVPGLSQAKLARNAAKVVSKATKTGTNVVYQGIDKGTGAVKYVGITQRAPAVRFGEHLNSGTAKSLLDYRVVPGATNMSRIDARIMEQTLINQHGLNNLLNIRNSIAPKNWWQYGIK